jgi:hypothetical protein
MTNVLFQRCCYFYYADVDYYSAVHHQSQQCLFVVVVSDHSIATVSSQISVAVDSAALEMDYWLVNLFQMHASWVWAELIGGWKEVNIISAMHREKFTDN